MIKRLLSFIRHMREPVFDDPKARRWADGFQKRARLTGQLPTEEMMNTLGIPADDPFWKQDNANPSCGFAVNLSIPMTAALAASSPDELKLEAVDDFGRSVKSLPISKTGANVYFHNNAVFLLEGAGTKMAVNEFVWKVARLYRDVLLELESEPEEADHEDDEDEDEPLSTNPADHTIRRITWSASGDSWIMLTKPSGSDGEPSPHTRSSLIG